jgi:hypothetical protein
MVYFLFSVVVESANTLTPPWGKLRPFANPGHRKTGLRIETIRGPRSTNMSLSLRPRRMLDPSFSDVRLLGAQPIRGGAYR